ncbi:hypothetical protein PR202_ga27806 [Eleusine coracana subsp. coracana]|uniref:Uncharacterized protein n=1 Tax=Eleusine coracana subsp. coracana TaxID=191504 RepID=A0AAV5DHL9_ELECO|nr:hypothetical protein PR202_ga27806 [Eleusine coracana subsp. coracana]
MFLVSVQSIVGDGKHTIFWTDCGLHGQSIQELAPSLTALVPKRMLNNRTVHDALTDLQWVDDVRGVLPPLALLEYFLLWDILQVTHLSPGVSDQHLWTPSTSGVYSSKSAYDRFLLGATHFEPAKLCVEVLDAS